MVAQDFARLKHAQADLLEKAVVEQATGYDYIVFDTIPQGLLQECAVYSADLIVVPAPVDYPGLDGACQFEQMVLNLERQNDLHPTALRVVPMFVDRRTGDARHNLELLQQKFGERVLPEVPMRTKMREAIAEGVTIYEFAPKEDIADIYHTICQQILTLIDQDTATEETVDG